MCLLVMIVFTPLSETASITSYPEGVLKTSGSYTTKDNINYDSHECVTRIKDCFINNKSFEWDRLVKRIEKEMRKKKTLTINNCEIVFISTVTPLVAIIFILLIVVFMMYVKLQKLRRKPMSSSDDVIQNLHTVADLHRQSTEEVNGVTTGGDTYAVVNASDNGDKNLRNKRLLSELSVVLTENFQPSVADFVRTNEVISSPESDSTSPSVIMLSEPSVTVESSISNSIYSNLTLNGGSSVYETLPHVPATKSKQMEPEYHELHPTNEHTSNSSSDNLPVVVSPKATEEPEYHELILEDASGLHPQPASNTQNLVKLHQKASREKHSTLERNNQDANDDYEIINISNPPDTPTPSSHDYECNFWSRDRIESSAHLMTSPSVIALCPSSPTDSTSTVVAPTQQDSINSCPIYSNVTLPPTNQ